MSLGLKYKNKEHIFDETAGKTPYLSFPLLSRTGMVKHGFSTRLGGVSQGCFSSLNLSFDRGDSPEAVAENFRRMGEALGVDCNDRGKGIVRERDYTDVDGLVTDRVGICLVTSYADCVPLYFLDPVKKVIGLSHSGWRGTVGRIGRETVRVMEEKFGSSPEDILAAIGPSVCMDCYEVSADVIGKFKECFDEKDWQTLFYEKPDGKYQLNLWRANELIFLEAGIRAEHIAVTNVCTHCNSRILYSHRAMGDKRGNLCAFLALKEEAGGVI